MECDFCGKHKTDKYCRICESISISTMLCPEPKQFRSIEFKPHNLHQSVLRCNGPSTVDITNPAFGVFQINGYYRDIRTFKISRNISDNYVGGWGKKSIIGKNQRLVRIQIITRPG